MGFWNVFGKVINMPWYNGDYPPSYKNQPVELRSKAVEIANELLLHGAEEGVAIATGLKRARAFFAKNNRMFPLSLDFEGKHYTGAVTPSEEKGANGMPVYFRVTLAGELFAYLCCGDRGWREQDNSGKPMGLINAIGTYIREYYE